MTEEKVGQIIRCVKECWWRVGVLLVILLGFLLVVAYGWPHGDWGFGWGAIGAIATVATGGVAALIAYRQHSQIKLGVKRQLSYAESIVNRDLKAIKKKIGSICRWGVYPFLFQSNSMPESDFKDRGLIICKELLAIENISNEVYLYVVVIDETKTQKIKDVESKILDIKNYAEGVLYLSFFRHSDIENVMRKILELVELIEKVEPCLDDEDLKNRLRELISRLEAKKPQLISVPIS